MLCLSSRNSWRPCFWGRISYPGSYFVLPYPLLFLHLPPCLLSNCHFLPLIHTGRRAVVARCLYGCHMDNSHQLHFACGIYKVRCWIFPFTPLSQLVIVIDLGLRCILLGRSVLPVLHHQTLLNALKALICLNYNMASDLSPVCSKPHLSMHVCESVWGTK